MGLTPRQSLRLVVLPQALKLAIPSFFNTHFVVHNIQNQRNHQGYS
jgi:ABC-type amino acid transport system permease subunit